MVSHSPRIRSTAIAVAIAAATAGIGLPPPASAVPPGDSAAAAAATSVSLINAPRPTIRVRWPRGGTKGKTIRVRVNTHGAGRVQARLITSEGGNADKRRTTSRSTFSMSFRATSARAAVRVQLHRAPNGRLFASSKAAYSPLPQRRTEWRSYGDGPVRANRAGQLITLRFRGRAGQLIDYRTPARGSDRARLVGPGGRVSALAASNSTDIWRLPRGGVYTLRTSHCHRVKCYSEATKSLQLRRLHRKAIPVNGDAVVLRAGRRSAQVGDLRPRGERVLLRRTRGSGYDLAVPDGRISRSNSSRVVIDPQGRLSNYAGYPVTHPPYPTVAEEQPDTTKAAFMILPAKLGRSVRMRASTALPATALQVDGPEVSTTGSAYRERVFTFTGDAGTLVYPPSSYPYQLGRLEAPIEGDPAQWTDNNTRVSPYDDGAAWLLPVTGTYHLYVFEPQAGTTTTMRLRQATDVGAIGVGAPAITFPAATAGQWAFATVDIATVRPSRLTASAASTNGAWEAVLAPTWSWGPCSRYGPQDCGARTYARVTDSTLSAPVDYWFGGEHLLVFRPAPGTAGSVDLMVEAKP